MTTPTPFVDRKGKGQDEGMFAAPSAEKDEDDEGDEDDDHNPFVIRRARADMEKGEDDRCLDVAPILPKMLEHGAGPPRSRPFQVGGDSHFPF